MRNLAWWISISLLIISIDAVSKDPCYFWPGAVYSNGKCFVFSSIQLNVSEAQSYCTDSTRGGNLAEPRSQEEWEAITDFVKNGSEKYYLGMEERGRDVFWMSDGQLAYIPTEWWSQDLRRPDESCVLVSADELHDIHCKRDELFVCEYYVGNPCDQLLPNGSFIDGSCFLLMSEKRNFKKSQAACGKMHAFLAEPKTEKLFTFLNRRADQNYLQTNVSYLRIGGKKTENPNEWRWDWSNEIIDWKKPITYNNSYLIMERRDGKWTWIGSEDMELSYICQRDIGDLCERDFPGGAHSSGYCFKLFETPKTWHDALETCKEHGSFLAEPQNKILNYALNRYLLYQNVPKAWLGGTDEEEEGKFIWATSRQEFNYTRWIEHEPNNTNKTEHYTLWLNTTGWCDMPLSSKHVFVCQKKLPRKKLEAYVVIVPALASTNGVGLVQITTFIRSRPVYIQVKSSKDFVTSTKSVEIDKLQDITLTETGIEGEKFMVIRVLDPITVVLFIKDPSSASSVSVLSKDWLGTKIKWDTYFVPKASDDNGKDSLLAITSSTRTSTSFAIYQQSLTGETEVGLTSGGINFLARRHFMMEATLAVRYTTMLSRNHYGIDGALLKANASVSVMIGKTRMNPNVPGDTNLEQILPNVLLGKAYVTFPSLPKDTGSKATDKFRVIAIFDNTTITIHDERPPSNSREVTLASAGDVTNVFLPTSGFYYIDSDKNFNILKYSNDVERSKTKSCISSLIPRHLWQYQFSFAVTQAFQGFDINVAVIFQHSKYSQVVWDPHVQELQCSVIQGTTMKGCIYNIEQELTYYHISLSNYQNKFMAYMHGSNENSSFCHPLASAHAPQMYSNFTYQEYIDAFWSSECLTSHPSQENTTTGNDTDILTFNTSLATDPETAQATAPSITEPFSINTTEDLNHMNKTSQEIEKIVKELEETLHVDPKSTSVYKRSKISVEDKRQSATFVGIGGILFITAVFTFIIMFDVLTILTKCQTQGKQLI